MRLSFPLLIGFLMLIGCSLPRLAGEAPAPRQLTEGEALYIRYCSGCHGWQGRGNGPMAMMFEVHPPAIAGSRLPENELLSVIKVLHGDAPVTLVSAEKQGTLNADIIALMTYLKRLPELDWEEIESGRHSYETLCAFCHGVYGRGDGIMASAQPAPVRNLADRSFQISTTDAQLARSIADGHGHMPGTAAVLDQDNLSALIGFVRKLSPGYELYERFCARCHGSDGYPPADAPGEVIGVPRLSRDELIGVAFDEEYFRSRPDVYIRAWVEFMYKSDHSSMPTFINQLEIDDVRKILAYLREVDAKR